MTKCAREKWILWLWVAVASSGCDSSLEREDGAGRRGRRVRADHPDAQGETCEEFKASRDCKGDGFAGTQYCARVGQDDGLEWGECLEYVECEPGDFVHCGECPGMPGPISECADWGQTCSLAGDTPRGLDSGFCDTPLVLSFDSGPVQMRPSPAATFDISTNGGCVSTDWPDPVTPWLALDLDESGTIESGRELFGSGTQLASGVRAPHGFAALAELDDNGDGQINGADARFSELVLWADHDADKTATLAELTPVAMRGILSIELAYSTDPRCDARGNCEMQRAGFTYVARGGDVRHGEVIDIYLSCQ